MSDERLDEKASTEAKKELDRARSSIFGSCTYIVDRLRQDVDIGHLMDDMYENLTEIYKNNDNKFIEEALLMNVYALQAIFEKAVMNFYEFQYMGSAPEWMNLGLKAQNQIRKTLATLADIRNPRRVAFIKNQAQAMQLNFQTQNLENELEKGNLHETLDSRRTIETISVESDNEALAKVNGA